MNMDAASSSPSTSSSYDNLREELSINGLDVFAPMNVAWYNDYIRQLGLSSDSTKYLEMAGDGEISEMHANGETTPFTIEPLPELCHHCRSDNNNNVVDGQQSSSLAFVIGNSKALWPCFLTWLRKKQQQQPISNNRAFIPKDPIDMYTTEIIQNAIEKFATTTTVPTQKNDTNNNSREEKPKKIKYDIFYASDMSPERLVDMNRAAYVASLCYFSEDLFLSIHPKFGAWCAFRAVVVIDITASQLGLQLTDTTPPTLDAMTQMKTTISVPPLPSFLPPLLTKEEAILTKARLADAIKTSSSCNNETDTTTSSTVSGGGHMMMSRQVAQKWALMRDSVSLGREYKYSTEQSEYHYTQDPSILLECLSRLPETSAS